MYLKLCFQVHTCLELLRALELTPLSLSVTLKTFFFYWSTVDLQCWVSFKCIANE